MTTGEVDGCWAACLGDCGGKLSREHTVSECFWQGENITVRGDMWRATDPKQLKLASLTSKVLCQKHNSELGASVDGISAEAARIIRESMRLLEVRKRIRATRYNVVRYTLNGVLWERWFLKTLINFTENASYNIRSPYEGPRLSADELVRVAFGRSSFSGKAGLWMAAEPPGGTRVVQEHIHYHSVIAGETLIGGFFSFYNYDFFLNLQSVKPDFPEFNARQTLHHCKAFCLQVPDRKNRPVLSQEILLDWSSGDSRTFGFEASTRDSSPGELPIART